MVRFLADADLNHAIVKGCRRHEPAMDFLSAHEAKLQRVPDPEVLAIATEQDRILVTHDVATMPGHFCEFLMTQGSSPGVFLVSQYASIGQVVNELVMVWTALEPEEWRNRILNIPL